MTFPPPYTLSFSDRARRTSLRYTAYSGLTLTVPAKHKKRATPTYIADILIKHRSWIERAHSRFGTFLQQEQTNRQLHFALTGAYWDKNEIITHSPLPEQQALCTFLRQQAKHVLPALLDEESRKTGLHYNKLTLRNTKTRWGSCSAEQNISLNIKLMFLPEPLVRDVLVHELCHTVHLHHGPSFWKLMASHRPCYRQRHVQLKNAWQHVPAWAY